MESAATVETRCRASAFPPRLGSLRLPHFPQPRRRVDLRIINLGVGPVCSIGVGPFYVVKATHGGHEEFQVHIGRRHDLAGSYVTQLDAERVGSGTSRAPLVMTEFALRALRSARKLRRIPLGVLLYTDEGRDALHSTAIISEATAKVERALVVRPATDGGALITNRHGARRYQLS